VAGPKSNQLCKNRPFLGKPRDHHLLKGSGVKHISRFERGKTISHDSYVDETLKPKVNELEGKISKLAAKD
jgi:hypothetical protein